MKPRRRLLQFTSRFLFATVALISMGLARLVYLENARQRVIKEIQARGGIVESEPLFGWALLRGRSIRNVTLPHSRTADFDLERLRLFPNIEQLTLENVHVSQAAEDGDMHFSAPTIAVDMNQLGDTSLNSLRPEWLRTE